MNTRITYEDYSVLFCVFHGLTRYPDGKGGMVITLDLSGLGREERPKYQFEKIRNLEFIDNGFIEYVLRTALECFDLIQFALENEMVGYDEEGVIIGSAIKVLKANLLSSPRTGTISDVFDKQRKSEIDALSLLNKLRDIKLNDLRDINVEKKKKKGKKSRS
jgi:hypothetical protein